MARPSKPVRQQVAHQVEQGVVVGDVAAGRAPWPWIACLQIGDLDDGDRRDHAGEDRDAWHEHLREGADDRRLAGRRDRVRRHRPLHLDEVRRPVAEGLHEPESEHDADDGPELGVEAGERVARPGVQLLLRRRGIAHARVLADPRGEAVPAPHVLEAEQRERRQRGDDHEELEHLVVDRRRQPAEGDVGEHDRGGDDERDPQRPAEQRLDDRAEQEQVDARDEQLRDGERDRVHEVRGRAEPAEHELRHRAHLRAVVERHHHDAEEEHRRDGADPEVVHGGQPELGAVRRHAHDLDRAEVGRDEGQSGHPRRERAPGEEEVHRVRHLASGQDADAEHEGEVDDDDQVVDGVRVDDRVAREWCDHGTAVRAECWSHSRCGSSPIRRTPQAR